MTIREELQKIKFIAFALPILTVIGLTVMICLLPTCGSNSTLICKNNFYFVYCGAADDGNAILSDCITAQSWGGAGYDFCYNEMHYAVVACYYSQTDASAVRNVLLSSGKSAEILEVKTEAYKLMTSFAVKNKELYEGNLKTLYSASSVLYECANGRESNAVKPEGAKECLNAVYDTLCGLYKANEKNCFTTGLERIVAQCEKTKYGSFSTGEIRALQVQIIDLIINIQLS